MMRMLTHSPFSVNTFFFRWPGLAWEMFYFDGFSRVQAAPSGTMRFIMSIQRDQLCIYIVCVLYIYLCLARGPGTWTLPAPAPAQLVDFCILH